MELDTLRHSTSHIMAQAVKRLFPGVKLAIGPAIEEGFYYDFDSTRPFLEEDLAKIEAEMAKIIKENYKFEKTLLNRKDALKQFAKMVEPYKVELIEDIPDEDVTIYKDGDFVDLCKGPHLDSTGQVKAFKLLSIAGAYWRGDEKNKMLQRIYGTAFETKAELDAYVARLEEAKKRDHRKLGKELELFMMDEKAGAGLVIYQPKGAMLRTIIEDWEKKEHLKRGYQFVIGPHILKSDIWIESGHYGYYKEHMYIFQVEGQEYAIKPMNCPAHILIYRSKTRSYKDLPIRYFELGSVYRHEKSGVLHGLLRVRGFTQDDAHIFCLREQAVDEIKDVIDFVIYALKIFGFKDFEIELSTKPDKYIGSDEDWLHATKALEDALKSKGLPYNVHEGEGAFYGPKIDIKLKDALGRAWQCATIQCDFALPQRFKLAYVGQDGKEYAPIMLHRVILGSMERFLGALIEHYGGAFPVWLSPVQAVIIPIADEHKDYAKKIAEKLRDNDIRTEIDDKNARMQHKIRDAEVAKVPYMLIVGGKEAQAESVSVRERSKGDLGPMKLVEFIDKIVNEVKEKRGGDCIQFQAKSIRVNDRIRIREVMIIGEDGTQLGVMPPEEGLKLAQQAGLDLVEIAPMARPPVCRIMDFSKFKYEQEKKEKEARKKQHATHIKEIRLKPKIGDHDYLVKLGFIKKFIERKDKVKVSLIFRGREMAHPELGNRVLERLKADIADVAQIEKPPLREGRAIIMIVGPK